MTQKKTATKDKQAFYATVEPWSIGTDVSKAKTYEAALKLAGLDWEVKLGPIYGPNKKVIEGRAAVERVTDGKVLGIPTPKYKIFQNREGGAFLNTLIKDKELALDRAGTIRGGQIVWMVARLLQEMKVGKDGYVPYLFLKMGHGCGEGGSIEVAGITQRLFCTNQIRATIAGLGDNTHARIVHNSKIQSNLQKAEGELARLNEANENLQSWLTEALSVEAKPKAITGVEDGLFGSLDEDTPTRRRKAIENFQAIYAAEKLVSGDTAYTLINAVTGYADHTLRYNGDSAQRGERRFQAVMIDGSAQRFKDKGFALVREAAPALKR